MLLPPQIPPIDGDEDAQTIYRLENECYKLRMSMAKVRKATQEWFFLETKLKNATDELDAAKEDRDLMLSGGGDITFGTEMDSSNNSSSSNDNNNTSSSGPAVVPLPLLSPIKTEAQIKQEKIEQDLQRIEGQLEDYPKFSPEWFKLKEELVELRIKSDEGDAKHKPNNNSNKVIDEAFSTPTKKHNKENENFNEIWDTEVQVELPPQFHFRPISPPPSPSSPSTCSSLSRSRIVQPSPGKPLTNTPGKNYYNFNTNDQDSIEQRTLLRSQHAVACEELDKFPQFSQEWFAAKTKAVLLEDQLEELENRSQSCGGSNRSFSGWSENEEEVEAISCADELECAMVAEALKQGYCVSPSFVGDDDLQGGKEGLDIGDDGGDTADLGLVLSTEDQPGEDKSASWLEPKFSPCLFDTLEDLQGQGGGGAMSEDKYQSQEDVGGVNADGIGTLPTTEDQRKEDQPTQPEVDKPASAVDSILDEFASMLGNVDDDQFEIKNYHAVIIQEQWSIHRNSRPFKRIKSRALNYQAATKDVAQKEKGTGFILPKNKYSQWETFAAVLIQNRWRSYQKRKKFQTTVSSITKVQAVARCKQQHVLFCMQREKAITIQCIARKHRASAFRRRLANKEVVSLLNESENVLQELKYLQAVIKLQRFWRDSQARLQKMKEVNALLEQSSYMLAQLTMLKSAVTIQRRWRVHREQLRYNKICSSIFIIQGVVRCWLKQRMLSKIGQLYDKHDALSEQLDNLTKYSREWCDTSEQMRVLRERIGKHHEMEESRHDNSSMQERSDNAPCIETESVDFASLRDTLEKKTTASTPKLPDNHWNEKFGKETTTPPPVATKASPPHSGVSVSQYKKSFEESSSAAEKSLSPESKKPGTQKLNSPNKPPTLKELGIECLRLSKRLNQLPKFSPEWTLSKVELRLVTEEMEYLYESSLNKGKP